VSRFLGGAKLPDEVRQRAGLARGERVLSGAPASGGTWLLGTRDALVIVTPDGSRRLPWERVEAADWDRDAERVRISEVGEFGQPRPVHTFTLDEPGDLLPLIRERVTASIVMQRRVAVAGRRGVLVIARRAPRGDGEITWACEYDEGVDPDDPLVRLVVDEALEAARGEVGPGPLPI
jgi:hypothetical protein